MVVGGDEGGEGGGEGGGGINKSPRVVLQTIKNQKYFSLGPFQGHNIFQRLIDDALMHLPMLGSVLLFAFFSFFFSFFSFSFSIFLILKINFLNFSNR